MTFGTTGDFIAIKGHAIKVHTDYQDAPDDYKHISEEVAALRILLDQVAQQYKRTAISSDDRYEGQKILIGCQDVLQDLSSLFEKYKRRALTIKRLPFLGVKLGEDNIITLREKLRLNTGLLTGFARRSVVPGTGILSNKSSKYS